MRDMPLRDGLSGVGEGATRGAETCGDGWRGSDCDVGGGGGCDDAADDGGGGGGGGGGECWWF